MNYTTKTETILKIIQKNCPIYREYEKSGKKMDDQLVYVYIQDITKQMDLYVCCCFEKNITNFLGDVLEYKTILVLADYLPDSNVLYIAEIPFCYFEGDTLFYKVYKKHQRPTLKEKQKELFILKNY